MENKSRKILLKNILSLLDDVLKGECDCENIKYRKSSAKESLIESIVWLLDPTLHKAKVFDTPEDKRNYFKASTKYSVVVDVLNILATFDALKPEAVENNNGK